eukprot:PLAT12642.1.p1 GENE.PLAT12642.1~~PLAT12642.1.p1  ORF type:complete len:621 (+),score=183.13 PLAT12642.1:36-1865(+)
MDPAFKPPLRSELLDARAEVSALYASICDKVQSIYTGQPSGFGGPFPTTEDIAAAIKVDASSEALLASICASAAENEWTPGERESKRIAKLDGLSSTSRRIRASVASLYEEGSSVMHSATSAAVPTPSAAFMVSSGEDSVSALSLSPKKRTSVASASLMPTPTRGSSRRRSMIRRKWMPEAGFAKKRPAEEYSEEILMEMLETHRWAALEKLQKQLTERLNITMDSIIGLVHRFKAVHASRLDRSSFHSTFTALLKQRREEEGKSDGKTTVDDIYADMSFTELMFDAYDPFNTGFTDFRLLLLDANHLLWGPLEQKLTVFVKLFALPDAASDDVFLVSDLCDQLHRRQTELLEVVDIITKLYAGKEVDDLGRAPWDAVLRALSQKRWVLGLMDCLMPPAGVIKPEAMAELREFAERTQLGWSVLFRMWTEMKAGWAKYIAGLKARAATEEPLDVSELPMMDGAMFHRALFPFFEPSMVTDGPLLRRLFKLYSLPVDPSDSAGIGPRHLDCHAFACMLANVLKGSPASTPQEKLSLFLDLNGMTPGKPVEQSKLYNAITGRQTVLSEAVVRLGRLLLRVNPESDGTVDSSDLLDILHGDQALASLVEDWL